MGGTGALVDVTADVGGVRDAGALVGAFEPVPDVEVHADSSAMMPRRLS